MSKFSYHTQVINSGFIFFAEKSYICLYCLFYPNLAVVLAVFVVDNVLEQIVDGGTLVDWVEGYLFVEGMDNY